MIEQQRETAFLRQFIAYDSTPERLRLDEELVQADRHVRCVRRATWLMAVLVALAAVGLGYSAVLLEEYPQNMSEFLRHFSVQISCALGLASLMALTSFVGLHSVYRWNLRQRREECLRLAAKALESRLGKPDIGL